MKGRGLKILAFVAIIVLALGITAAASAAPDTKPLAVQETCPAGGDWVKVEGLSGTSYTYTAPAGKVIVGWCYKASTFVVFGVVDPPQTSYTVTSTVGHDLSHASFQLAEEPPDPATVSVVPGTCVWDGEVSETLITVTITGNATITITGPGGPHVFTSSGSVNVGPGSYSWSAVAGEGYEIVGPSSGQFTTESCEPEEEVLTIVTSSECIDEITMSYETVVTVPLESDVSGGDLWILWFYPNGVPFITGPTFLGTVPLVIGNNVFTDSMTTDELIAAIGQNNLTGVNPANDFNYDKLDLYTYQVILVIPDVTALWSNYEYLWEDCTEGGTCCECPTCGPPIQETMGESMGIAWYSLVPCTEETCWTWFDEHNPIVKIWTRIKNFVQHEGELIEVEEIVDANGEICYVDFFYDGKDIGDFILWGPDGKGDRIRDHFPASDPQPHKYSACSIFPSWCDTRLEDGVQYALYLPGHNVSDWALFLLNNGFFPDVEKRGTAALEWADNLRIEGKLELPPR